MWGWLRKALRGSDAPLGKVSDETLLRLRHAAREQDLNTQREYGILSIERERRGHDHHRP